MTEQPTTKGQILKPTLGEDITELFSRVAKLNDQMSAVLAPEWGARMGLLPEGHPLRPELPDADPEEQAAPVDWEAIARQRERELKQVGAARHRAEEELRRYAEADSVDTAAGSYAGRAERAETKLRRVAELADRWGKRTDQLRVAADHIRAVLAHDDYSIAQPEPWLHIAFTSPDETTANTSALALADHLRAEFPGVGMRITSNAVEGGKGTQIVGTPGVPDFTGPLTGIEVRDPCPWCESSPTLIPRQLMAEHVATVHPEVRTGGPGIPVADVESVIVCTTACDEQHTYDWTCELFAGISDEPPRTTPDNSPTSEDEADNPTATEATSLQTRVTGLYEQWVKAGPPPLGVSTARWWDRRLAELHHAIRPAADERARTTVKNPAEESP